MAARSFGAAVGAKAAQTFAARLLVSAFAVLTGIIVARALGPEGKGVYSGVQTLLSIPVAVAGGAGAAITYLMTKQRRTASELLPAIAVTFGLITAFCTAACAIYAGIHGWTLAAIGFAAGLPPSVVIAWQQNYYVAADRLRTFNIQSIAIAFGTLALTAAALAFGRETPGVIAAWLLALYAGAVAIAADVARDAGRLHRRELGARLREFAQFGAQSALNSGLGLLNYRVDSLILIALLGLPVFGVYSVAVSIGELLFMIARPVNAAVGREIGVASEGRAAEITAHVVRAGFAICLLCAVPLAVFAPLLVHAVYGARFDAAATPMRVLLPGIVAFSSAGTFASFFIFQLGRPLLVTAVNIVMIAAQTAACFALVPRFGLAGAALASTVTYVAGALFNTVVFFRATRIPPGQLWIPKRADAQRIVAIVRELVQKRRAVAAPAADGGPVLITGAAGNVFGLVGDRLRDALGPLWLTDAVPFKIPKGEDRFIRADLRSVDAARKTMRGARAVVHLGGISKENSFDRLLEHNMRATYSVLEAARLEGVRRVVLAGTGHVTGFYPRAIAIDESAPVRPDSFYAVSKVFAEALGRHYADKYGLEVVCLRIGHVAAHPQYDIDRAIWISPRDLAQLLLAALEHEPVSYTCVYGISNNSAAFWSLDRARSLGYEPLDSVDDIPFRAEPPADPDGVEAKCQGESFAARNFCARGKTSVTATSTATLHASARRPGLIPAGPLVE
ncbi:MAG: NAD-dependent epimerase/dehydratase family protein [Candidatus Baltobacteraceae bacterium]